MNAIAHILGGVTLLLIIVLPVLALVRPRKLLEASGVIGSLTFLILAMQLKGGVQFGFDVVAEFFVALLFGLALFMAAKKIVKLIVKNDTVLAEMKNDVTEIDREKKREKIVLIGSAIVFGIGVVILLVTKFGSPTDEAMSNPVKEIRNRAVIVMPENICYVLINNGNPVKISGELQGYVTTQYDKDGYDAFVFFKKGTNEKQVRDYWWAHKQEILNLCGFLDTQ